MVIRLASVAALLGVLVACLDDPCQEYVDYICECHADDPEFDCSELERTYDGADPDVLDQCQIDLSDQKAEDDAAGLECDTSDSSEIPFEL